MTNKSIKPGEPVMWTQGNTDVWKHGYYIEDPTGLNVRTTKHTKFRAKRIIRYTDFNPYNPEQ